MPASFKVSNELPFEEGGNNLFRKNFKRVYVGNEQKSMTVLQAIMNGADVMETQTTINAYLAVDAKNRPSDLDTALSVMAQARTQSGISNSFRNEFTYTTEIDGSFEIYTFEYIFRTIA
jgi:hypothetical protein